MVQGSWVLRGVRTEIHQESLYIYAHPRSLSAYPERPQTALENSPRLEHVGLRLQLALVGVLFLRVFKSLKRKKYRILV